MLVGSKCDRCSNVHFPPKTKCVCGGDVKDITFSGNGKIVSYTTIRTAPKGFDAPYIVGIIKLDEGPRITGQIVGEATTIDIDKCVKVVFRKLKEMSDGLNIYGFKFELI